MSVAGRPRVLALLLIISLFALGGPPMRAASVPAGFTESLVASGLSNPTAMQFAPDGRLFVCEQGGRLRVIKNGALLPTPFLTVTVSSVGERGLLGVAFDPAFAVNQLRLRLLHGDDADDTQPHQPLHRQRRRRGAGQRGRHPRARQSQQRDQPQRRRLGLRSRRQALRRRRRERERRERAVAGQPARQDAAPQRRRHRSRPTTRSTPRRPARTARSGRSACAIRSRSRSAAAPAACSSTTSARARGKRSTTASPAPTTAGRTPKDRRPIRGSCRRATPTTRPARRCAITGGAFYTPLTVQFPASLRRRLLLRRLLRRLDPQARSGERQRRHGLCDRHRVAGRPEGRRRRRALLPGARGGPARSIASPTARRCRRSRSSRRAGRSRPDSPVDVQRPRLGPGAAALSVAAQRRQHRRRDGAGLHARRGRRPTTAPASAPSSATTSATS